MKPKVYKEGCMCEGYPWEIHFDAECLDLSGGEPCKHCHSEKIKEHKYPDGNMWNEKVWKCPRVVVAYNEGHCNLTQVCLDCILEAAKELEEK